MISSLEGKMFEPVEEDSDNLGLVISFQDDYLIPRMINDKSSIIVHVLKGPEIPTQGEFYTSAWNWISDRYPSIFERIKIDYLHNKDIRREGMHPSDVADWLLSSHVHLIYTHVHQGKLIVWAIHNFNRNCNCPFCRHN